MTRLRPVTATPSCRSILALGGRFERVGGEAGVAERDPQVGHGHPPVTADIDAPEQRDSHDATVVSVMDGGALGNTAA